ncbi:MAG: cytochrome c oxidase subunit 3 [Gammaproteobacteria bacterium]|nr:cytochrome c oxidase subunit 3 [Gammaproteobacteria bacterium]
MTNKIQESSGYYVPHSSWWPFATSIILGLTMAGFAEMLHGHMWFGALLSASSFFIGVYVIGRWFKDVVTESLAKLYNQKMYQTFRMGMIWFIFSECCFFAGLLAALIYIRLVSVPMLGGAEGYHISTREFLYPEFQAQWPLLDNPVNTSFHPPIAGVGPWGWPLINTAILLISALTLTFAHHFLLKGKNKITAFFIFLTSLLGSIFLVGQAIEYLHAYEALKLTLGSGVYASIFYFITGFHGLHVLIGTIFLFIIGIRLLKNHFTTESHFAFEAAAWYWHFVDMVWWCVFVMIYCL